MCSAPASGISRTDDREETLRYNSAVTMAHPANLRDYCANARPPQRARREQRMRVRRAAAVLVTVSAATAGLGIPAAQAAKHPEGMDIRAASAHGQVPARNAKSGTSPRRSPNMLWHNGAIMNDA